ncbi:hypothetical protein PCL_09824 [Purpureocillium lilacinum]|uniref:Uncharacterized protein n=1 Tax=Purpureocillium lilacinum TaxID=33203 RepID=A0A2U3EE71_PURLI|nr:hypothetical protein PCL_09824 [Purpureocillium lilacinum]
MHTPGASSANPPPAHGFEAGHRTVAFWAASPGFRRWQKPFRAPLATQVREAAGALNLPGTSEWSGGPFEHETQLGGRRLGAEPAPLPVDEMIS